MAAATVNPLMSTQKSDSSLQVALHPLPILEISDYITRSYLRGYKGAIVGALIGQQNGRQITIEHSFSVKTEHTGQNYKVDSEWFTARLDQSQLPSYNNTCAQLQGSTTDTQISPLQ